MGEIRNPQNDNGFRGRLLRGGIQISDAITARAKATYATVKTHSGKSK
jgi:hypothetical protein